MELSSHAVHAIENKESALDAMDKESTTKLASHVISVKEVVGRGVATADHQVVRVVIDLLSV